LAKNSVALRGALSHDGSEAAQFFGTPPIATKTFSYSIVVKEHDLEGWICFGYIPMRQQRSLEIAPNRNIYEESISACTDHTYFDYFDNKNIDRDGIMPFRWHTKGKQFIVSLEEKQVVVSSIGLKVIFYFFIKKMYNRSHFLAMKKNTTCHGLKCTAATPYKLL
jgi:hypothetical protein